MTLLELKIGTRLDYRGFQRRAAPADRSAAFGDTTAFHIAHSIRDSIDTDALTETSPGETYVGAST